MLQEDFELANQAFSRAQSSDPDYTLAWIGQGMVAALLGEVADAQELFEHAFQIGGVYNVSLATHNTPCYANLCRLL